jgi:DNA mismatch repair protein MutS2
MPIEARRVLRVPGGPFVAWGEQRLCCWVMAAYAPGDRVHVAALGTGVVREVRNGGRYLVELKGRSMILPAARLEAAPEPRRAARPPRPAGSAAAAGSPLSVTIDLHGLTAAAAVEAVDAFVNQALLAGATEARIIHGRSGGTLKAAVHRRLKELPGLEGFAVDAGNPGVTIVRF